MPLYMQTLDHVSCSNPPKMQLKCRTILYHLNHKKKKKKLLLIHHFRLRAPSPVAKSSNLTRAGPTPRAVRNSEVSSMNCSGPHT